MLGKFNAEMKSVVMTDIIAINLHVFSINHQPFDQGIKNKKEKVLTRTRAK